MTANDIAAFLASAGCGTVGTNLTINDMPDTPDTCGTVYEYPGRPPQHVFGQSAIDVEFPRVQVVFRGPARDHATPRSLAETAYRAMAAAGAQTVGGARVLAMIPQQPPFKLDRDSKERWKFAFNAEVHKGLSS